MSRGPVSEQAIEWATVLAEQRGSVYFFPRDRQSPCDFQIVNDHGIIFVAVKRSRIVYRSFEALEDAYRETVGRLRAVPNPAIDRQLWLFSRKGRCRTIRITATGMEEIPAGDTSPGNNSGEAKEASGNAGNKVIAVGKTWAEISP